MKYFLGIFAIIIFTTLNYYNSRSLKSPDISLNVNEKHLALNYDLVKLLCLGHTRMCSSLLWTDTMLKSDIVRTDEEDKERSWMFYRFKLIASLDPLFFSNYLLGGIYLSIVKDEPKNAKQIYELGLKEYPNSLELNLNAAFNDQYELGLSKDASEKYKVAFKVAPDDNSKKVIARIISKINAGIGNLDFAFNFLHAQYKITKIPSIKVNLGEQLYAIRAEIDLECLNKNKGNCPEVDFYGLSYIKENGVYKAQRKWEKFRLKKKKGD